MESAISTEIMEQLYAQAVADPQLPRTDPTTSFWQLPPHPLMSETQSATLPTKTDYAIIGSGVTGCSMAKTLLDNSPSHNSSITVFEARKLTSGATGRNGGLLTSFVPGHYKHLSGQLGHDEAVKIARFANRTLEKMHSLANSSDELKEASLVRRTLDIITFDDYDSFNDEVASLKLYEEHVTEDAGKSQILTAEEAATVSGSSPSCCALSSMLIELNTETQCQGEIRSDNLPKWRVLAIPIDYTNMGSVERTVCQPFVD